MCSSGRLHCLALAALLLIFQSPVAHAVTFYYDTDRHASLRACDAHQYVGEKEAADTCYQELLEADDALVRADAAAALGDVQLANRSYREAANDSADPAIKTHWGQLYLNTHQTSDAMALFREALVYDQSYLPAQLGLAEAMSRSFEGKAREDLNRITVEQPDNVRALLMLARIELELQNLTIARALLNRAMMEAEEQQLPQLEIYALHAGANLLDGIPIERWTRRALAINPSYGDVYAIPAHFYIITYRYREAVELYQQAVNTDPSLASAHRDLGINLLRINNVFGARYHLQKAYDIDPFDAETVNTLRLLDKLDGMRVTFLDVYADEPSLAHQAVSDVPGVDALDAGTAIPELTDPAQEAERAISATSNAASDPGDDGTPNATQATPVGRVMVRLDREDADALEPYVLDLTKRAMRTFTERYGFQLRKPMIVELFHDHDDFGVRTVSTPGIGLLGVTFGYLTAMDSPKARAAGDFHWGSTLWHEIAHVYTLEATDHRLPRWFSEGLSVYEEWNTGPLADRELPLDALTAMKSGTLLPIDDLDLGFVRPTYAGQVQVSYMQAGLICDFIATRWGHEALVVMLRSFADGLTTSEALHAAIDIDGAEFDELFANYLKVTYGDLTDSLDDYVVAGRQLLRAVEVDDWISAEALARDMIRRYPQRVGRGNAYEVLAKAQTELGEDEEALATLVSWFELGGHEPSTLQSLARELRELDRIDEAVAVLESLNWVMPYVTDEHRWLGDYYLETGRPRLAMREFDALLGLQADDPAAAYLGKAQAAKLLGDESTAKRQVLFALENAPFYRSAQRLLLELNAGDRFD